MVHHEVKSAGFTAANGKIRKVAAELGIPKSTIYAWTLPAGWTCPAADICLSRADRASGHITDAAGAEFRCYAASLEAVYKGVRDKAWHNFDGLKAAGLRDADAMAEWLQSLLPANAKVVRIHVGGDYVTREYFQAWLIMAERNPDVIFYGYTKVAEWLPQRPAGLPENFKVVISHGGKQDHLRPSYHRSHVVFNQAQADKLGVDVMNEAQSELEIIKGNRSFALLIHGTQAAGTDASKAWQKVKQSGHSA